MLKINNIYHTIDKIEEYLEKLINEYEIDVIIEITRKGYWVTKLADRKMNRRLSQIMKNKKIRRISDRYLMKCLNFDAFKDKSILIFDDTMNNGNLLFFYYALLKEKGAKKVIPCVYALNTHYDPHSPAIEQSRRWGYERTIRSKIQDKVNPIPKEEIEQKFQKCRKAFEEDLKCCIWMSPADVGRLSVTETLWFQKEVMPMVVDLPIYSKQKDQEEGENYLTIPKVKWDQLREGNSLWRNEDCRLELAGEELYYGYFQYLNDAFYARFKNLIFNFIVRYKYEPVENQELRIVFVPFVIMNSCKLSDLVWNFFYLFKDTEYASDVAEELNKKAGEVVATRSGYTEENSSKVLETLKKNHNMCRALYRAIIFDISNYIGIIFQNYVKETIDLEIMCDWEIMKENLQENLIQSLKVKYEEKQKEDYLSKLMEIRMSEQIVPRMDSLEEAVIKQKATDENLELLLTQIVIERKQKVDITTAQVMITLESLCHEVRKQYLFDGESDFKKKITDLLLIMTENSRLGNEIYVDDNAEILYRGFRAGENCEVLMHWGIEWLYPYILAFYEKVGIWEFHDRYDVFFGMLEQEFRKNGYIGTLISESAFSFYRTYFSKESINSTEILNKEYLMDDNANETNRKLDDYCDIAFHMVTLWDV